MFPGFVAGNGFFRSSVIGIKQTGLLHCSWVRMGGFVNFISHAWLSGGLLAAALLVAHPLASAASDLPDVQRLIERRDFKQALVKVNQYLAVRPDSIDGRFYKGVILAEANEVQQAIVLFTQLTQDAPQMLEAYNNLGVLYARQQEYDKARATLEAALKVDPAFAAVSGNLRNTYGRLAKQAYDKALGQESGPQGGGKSLVMLSQLRAPSVASEKALEVVASKLGATALPPLAQPVVTAAPVAAPAPAQKVAQASAVPAVPAPESKAVAASERKVPEAKQPSPEKEVRQAVDAWVEAWVRKDMKAYLDAYGADFKVPGDLSRKDWERERTKRISGKKDPIQIVLEKLDIDVQDGVATARFLQRYKSGSISESTRKTLTLTRRGGKWRIKSEK